MAQMIRMVKYRTPFLFHIWEAISRHVLYAFFSSVKNFIMKANSGDFVYSPAAETGAVAPFLPKQTKACALGTGFHFIRERERIPQREDREAFVLRPFYIVAEQQRLYLPG